MYIFMQRFATPPVPGIPPHAMYKVDPAGIGVPTTAQSGPHPLLDFHPVCHFMILITNKSYI